MKFVKWVCYGVLVPILPIGLLASICAISKVQVTLENLIGKGELLIVCAAICATAVGDFISYACPHRKSQWFCLSVSFLVVVITSAWFAVISLHVLQNTDYDKDLVTHGSLWVFLFTLIPAACSVILSTDTPST